RRHTRCLSDWSSDVCSSDLGLLLRTLWNLERVPLGLESDRVVTASFVLGRQGYRDGTRQLAFFDELERRLRALPGVEAAAISDTDRKSTRLNSSHLGISYAV